jgi:hypothetical protein
MEAQNLLAFLDLFAGQVGQRGEAIAVRHGEAGVTYRSLDAKSHCPCAWLRGRGMGRNTSSRR